ncbi:glycosyltransferase [Azospirillum thiophilum]|uniref:glycosyltransferase n=1 Tax=Azospirillum thiophilum TaxID=528244 RepID=UPI000B07B2FB|nr:glycosyltransferase [Azospirillum thiophilum]
MAILNPIDPSHPVAERELALRIARAIEGLGWETAILSRSLQVETMDPDGVLCLHPQVTAKLTHHPWLACYWNPPSLLKGASDTARVHGEAFELTFDAYLVSGSGLESHLAGLMAELGRDPPPCLPFHVSSPRSALTPNLGPHSRLFYVGSNWDGKRYPTLLRRLAEADALALHGTQERWSHLPEAYQGPLPFDGRSVIGAAHHWGMGLCLHLPQHRAYGVPNMRVFELAAAGAVIIADRHPFIEHWFADNVLYIDTDGGEEETAARILDRVAWIRSHPAEARAMAAAAQSIFNRHLCLERLLEPLPGLLAALARDRSHPRSRPVHVGVLLPGTGDLAERLKSLNRQKDEGCLSLTALIPAAQLCADSTHLAPGPTGLTIRSLAEPAGPATLQAALDGIDALAILPEGIEWHQGHLAGLAAAAEAEGGAIAAGIWPAPEEPTGFPIDPAEPLALPPPDDGLIPEGRRLARAWLRAGGFYCRVERLDGLAAESEDWLTLALNLPPALAEAGELSLPPVPSLTLLRLPAPTLVPALRAWPGAKEPESRDRPPRLTGINDLNPALAASVPFLWRPGDFEQLPAVGPLWLYGAGQGGELVHDGLPAAARTRLRGFLDSRRQGEMLGLPLLRPSDLDPAEMAATTIIIAAQYVSDILLTLRRGQIAPARIVNAYPYIAARQEAMARRQADPPLP